MVSESESSMETLSHCIHGRALVEDCADCNEEAPELCKHGHWPVCEDNFPPLCEDCNGGGGVNEC